MADRVGVANVPAGTTNTVGVEALPGLVGADGTALERQSVALSSGEIGSKILATLISIDKRLRNMEEAQIGFADSHNQ